MTYPGSVTNGVVVLADEVALPDGTLMRVEAIGEAQATRSQSGSVAAVLVNLAGTIDDSPKRSVENHDHYLCGTPTGQSRHCTGVLGERLPGRAECT